VCDEFYIMICIFTL